jgi:hypothetical protein
MAAGALHRQAAERIQGRDHHVVPVEAAGQLAVGLRLRHFNVADEVPRPGGDEPQRGDAVHGVRRDDVSGELFGDEPAIRFVGIEGPDDVIAVRPGVESELVLVVAVGFAKVDDIQPVPGPPLAVVGRIQQPVYQLLVGVGAVVGEECGDGVRRRGQAEQVVRQPSDQRAAIGLRRRRQAAGCHRRQ